MDSSDRLNQIAFRANAELDGMIELVSPDGAYLLFEPDDEGLIVYTNLSRGRAVKMLVSIHGEPRKWVDAP